VFITPNAEARALERGVPLTRVTAMMADPARRRRLSRRDRVSGSWVMAEGPIRVVWDEADNGDVFISTIVHR
jgi:hypothetical protein